MQVSPLHVSQAAETAPVPVLLTVRVYCGAGVAEPDLRIDPSDHASVDEFAQSHFFTNRKA